MDDREDKVAISLAVDTTKLENILSRYRTNVLSMKQAREQINDLYEYNARNFQIKLNIEANRMMEEQLELTKSANAQQHEDLQELVEVLRHDTP